MNMFKSFRRYNSSGLARPDVRLGDVAREAKRWGEAAVHYRRHLQSSPLDVDIWIQLGHSLEEVGDLQGAHDAYERAIEDHPDHVDALLHRAHLLKRMNRPQLAHLAFLDLMRLAPTEEVRRELAALGLGAETKQLTARVHVAETSPCYFEVRDFLNHVERHPTLTGIHRVVLGVIHHILDEADADGETHRFVCQSDDAQRLFLVSNAVMRRIVQAVMTDVPDRLTTAQLVMEARQSWRPLNLNKGDVYFLPGAFWTACDNPGFLPRLKRAGAIVGCYLYDLIPITHPQYCEASLTQRFNVALAETLPLLDFCLTISEHVGRELAAFLSRNRLRPLPIVPVPLAHEMRLNPEAPRWAPLDPDLAGLCRRPFVLCVCTIEARKNHAYLIGIWQRMIEEGLDVPDLVFVGRIGWRVADLMAMIEASNCLDGRLHILNDVADADLAALYENCLFTVFPSFVEGWGLPVGESLSHGKLCVASSTSSIPEVGGNLVLYVDPFNQGSGYDVISGLLRDPSERLRREADVRAFFRARTWTAFGRDFLDKLDQVAGTLAAAAPTAAPCLRPGEMMSMERLFATAMTGPDYVRNPLRLMFAAGWRTTEATGTWLQDPAARLVFRTAYAPGCEVVVMLQLSASPWVDHRNALHVWASDGPPPRGERGSNAHAFMLLSGCHRFWVKVRGTVGGDGVVTVQLKVDGPVKAEGNNMPVAVRLHTIGHAALDDITARMDLLESRDLAA